MTNDATGSSGSTPFNGFDVGDRVRHRASGRIAIVTAILYGCVKHPPLALCGLRLDRSECRLEPTGQYHLSFDFDEDAESVSGFLLERADDSRGRND